MSVLRKISGLSWALIATLGLSAGAATATAQTADGVFRYPERVLTPVGTGRTISFSESLQPQPLQPQAPTPIQTQSGISRDPRGTSERPALGKFALKTNLLYWATLTPNAQLEVAISPHLSIELGGSWTEQSQTTFDLETGAASVKSLQHWVAKPEVRYWFDRPFSKHFVGVSGLYGDYLIGGYDIPMLFDQESFYDGTAVGGGVVYGYHWAFSRRLRAEFSLGAGVLQMTYDKTEAGATAAQRFKKTYMGPTQAGVKLIFMIR